MKTAETSPSVDRPLDDQSGITLVELLVVIIVIAIVAGLALMQRGSANEQFQRQNVARELKVAFERARFDSVKRRAVGGTAPQAYVTVTPTSFTLHTYSNDVNGVAIVQNQGTTLPTGIAIARHDGTALTTFDVSFNMRGETPQSPPPQFWVCKGDCATASAADKNIVLVTATGTVNLLKPGVGLPSFGVPSVNNVSNTAGVNPDTVFP